MSAIDGKIILTKNDCYKIGQRMTPQGIVVHSTGVNNPNLRRYIAPDDGIIGKNDYNNDWNRGGLDVCVHGFLGKDKKGKVKFYQTLPFDMCCWGVGGGWNGSYNYNPPYIQFEMCEDGLNDKVYCKACYDKAVEVCAYLCKKYNISVANIVSHHEAYLKGYGSNHGDPHNWWDKFGYTMDGFRAAVKKKLSGNSKVALKENGALYQYGYKDILGGTSKVLKNIKKGDKVEFIKDDGWGWSKIKSGTVTGWVMNSHLNKSGLSKFKTRTLGADKTAIIIDTKKKTAAGAMKLKKGTKYTLYCTIESGKYKDKSYIGVGKARYYI